MTGELIGIVVPLLFAGCAVGLFAGLLGIGGGIVTVPVMSLVLVFLAVPASVSMHVALATSLATIVFTSIASARAHSAKGALDGRVVKSWGPYIAAGALVGGLLARFVDGDWLRVLFATLAALLGIRFLLARELTRRTSLPLSGRRQHLAALSIGGLSSWLGIGGGSFSVPLLNAMGLSVHRAVGTSALLGLFIALPATVGYAISGSGITGRPAFSLGYLHLPSVLALTITASLFAPLGARLAHALPQTRLKQVFGVFLLIAACRMAWRVYLGS